MAQLDRTCASEGEVAIRCQLSERGLKIDMDQTMIIKILDVLVPSSPKEFEDVYIVFDLMETDLHRIIDSRQDLSLDHVQYFLFQVLRALKYMHASNVLHRDLKPSNLLLNSNCDLKICDLGLARDMESGSKELTEYVVTRWYRAPEMMLSCRQYDKAIDVWSAGCIFAELMLRKPYFPGENYIDQLTIICEKLGKPNIDDLDFVTTDKARRFIMSLADTSPRCLRDQFPPTASSEALDLLSRMLEFHPARRISVADALLHPFMRSLHATRDEPEANLEFCFDFEEETLTRYRLKELVWDEMRSFHPEQGPWRGDLSEHEPENSPAAVTPTTSTFRGFSRLGAEFRASSEVIVPSRGSSSSEMDTGDCSYSEKDGVDTLSCSMIFASDRERSTVEHGRHVERSQVTPPNAKPCPQHSFKEKKRSVNILCSPGVEHVAPRPITRASKRARSVNLAPGCSSDGVEKRDEILANLATEAVAAVDAAATPTPPPPPLTRVAVAVATGSRRQRTKHKSLGSVMAQKGRASTCIGSLGTVVSARRRCISRGCSRADKGGESTSEGRTSSVDGSSEQSSQGGAASDSHRISSDAIGGKQRREGKRNRKDVDCSH